MASSVLALLLLRRLLSLVFASMSVPISPVSWLPLLLACVGVLPAFSVSSSVSSNGTSSISAGFVAALSVGWVAVVLGLVGVRGVFSLPLKPSGFPLWAATGVMLSIVVAILVPRVATAFGAAGAWAFGISSPRF